MSLITSRRLGLCLLMLGAAACTGDTNTFSEYFVDVVVEVYGSSGSSGSGRVFTSSLPEGDIDCRLTAGVSSGTCDEKFKDTGGGGIFTFAETPDAGSVFSGWRVSGSLNDCPGTETLCQVRFTTGEEEITITVRPIFDLVRTLTVTGAGTGNGSVVSSPAGINCTITAGEASGTCAAAFTDSTDVTLTPTPAAGSVFLVWTDACSGAAACPVTMTVDKSATAQFDPLQPTLTVTGAGTGDGSVVSSPEGINCTITAGAATGTCAAEFADGTDVTLTPTAAVGSTFAAWTGACGGAGSCAVTMTADKSATAQFDLGPQPGDPFTRSLFATVIDAFTIDFNGTGDLFVSNTGNSVSIPGLTYVRKVTPDLEITDFGDRVSDPDIVLVDKLGSIASVPQSVLVGGITDFGTGRSRITEITPDGTTNSLIETTGPILSNPSAFAFLPNGKLLIGNYGSNTVSVLSKDPLGALSLAEFYTDILTDGIVAVAFHKGVVYVITRSGKLTTLDEFGGVITDDLWPASGDPSPPKALAADISEVFFDGDLLVATENRLLLMDTATGLFSPVGNFTFDNGIFGLAVSPLLADGGLYVSEGDAGQIWRVVKN